MALVLLGGREVDQHNFGCSFKFLVDVVLLEVVYDTYVVDVATTRAPDLILFQF